MSESKTTRSNDEATGNGADTGSDGAQTAAHEDLQKLRVQAAERDQFLELLQRTQADFENYQKRNRRDREQERRFVHSSFAFDLLPILDNLERATVAAEQAGEKGPLVEGVAMVHSQFLDFLKRYGVTPIDAKDKPFDPNLHQAVMQMVAADKPANTVVQVLEPGYMIHDRVLRPAKVIVSKTE